MIERSLLDRRPCFFITAGRRGGGKTTTMNMLIMAVTGLMPSASAWSSNEEERRKALLAYFLSACRTSCGTTSRAARRSHVRISSGPAPRPTIPTAGSASAKWSHCGRNHSPLHRQQYRAKGRYGLAQSACPARRRPRRPGEPRVQAPRPVGWTEKHRAEILAALYTILLGNPQLKEARDAAGKTRFKMWWRLVGSAVEHAAKLKRARARFSEAVHRRREDDEEATSLADVLEILVKRWPEQKFMAKEVASVINNRFRGDDGQTLREFLLPGAMTGHVFSSKSIGMRLKKHLDGPVYSGERTIVLRSEVRASQQNARVLRVEVLEAPKP